MAVSKVLLHIHHQYKYSAYNVILRPKLRPILDYSQSITKKYTIIVKDIRIKQIFYNINFHIKKSLNIFSLALFNDHSSKII